VEQLARSQSGSVREVRRARIISLACKGMSNGEIAGVVGCTEKTARLWRGRFAADPRLESLQDQPRSGRPRVVPVTVRAKLISLACSRAHDKDKRPFHDLWTRPLLQSALLRETGVKLSISEIGRTLGRFEVRPHRTRMWLKSQDPQFDEKCRRVCGLYLNPTADTTVLSIDEKRLFAHERVTPLRPARLGSPCQKEFQYRRNGTSTLLAAFNVGSGEVFGECRPTRKGEDLVDFMEAVAKRVPGNVVVIWDNLNVHYDGKDQRWTRFNERHGGRFTFVYTPKHASWLNQVEVWFSILERRILRNGSYASVDELVERTTGFIDHWNQDEAHPFRWTFRGNTARRRPCPLLANASEASRRSLARRRAA
jgi:transposase